MSWEKWIAANKDNIKHVAGFEERFVRDVLTKIEAINPEDVKTQYHFKDSQGGNRYIDFMIINESKGFLLPIELDGMWKVQSYCEFDDMLSRQNALLREYGVLLRYTNKLMINNPQEIIDEIQYTLSLQSKNQLTKEIVDNQTAQRIRDYQNELELVKQQHAEQIITDQKNKKYTESIITKNDLAALQATISSLQNEVEKVSQNESDNSQSTSNRHSTIAHRSPPLPILTPSNIPNIKEIYEPKKTRFQLAHIIGLGVGCLAITAYSANLYFKPTAGSVESANRVSSLTPIVNTSNQEQSEKVYDSINESEDTKSYVSNEPKVDNEAKTSSSILPASQEEISIDASEAKNYIGSYRVVCGDIAQVKKFSKGTYLNFGASYPRQDATIVVWTSDSSHFGNLNQYNNKRLCVEGTINTYKGTPQIKLASTNKIK